MTMDNCLNKTNRENPCTWRKPSPGATFPIINPTRSGLGLNPVLRHERPTLTARTMARPTASGLETLWICVRVLAESTVCQFTGYSDRTSPLVSFLIVSSECWNRSCWFEIGCDFFGPGNYHLFPSLKRNVGYRQWPIHEREGNTGEIILMGKNPNIYPQKGLSQCHLVCWKSHMNWPGIESWPPLCQATSYPHGPWHNHVVSCWPISTTTGFLLLAWMARSLWTNGCLLPILSALIYYP
jgi:hypothetical protein